MNLKMKLYILYKKISLVIFGNSLGIKMNYSYFKHQMDAQKKFNFNKLNSPMDIEKAGLLKKTGFVFCNPVMVDDLATTVNDYFTKNPTNNGYGEMNRAESALISERVYHLVMDSAAPVLNAYYGSHFQPYWSSVLRYDSNGIKTADSSFGFHIDDNPKQILKIFIYLNDTFEKNGAFRAFNYKATNKLFRRGFISSSPELRIAAQKIVTKKLETNQLNVLEGIKGTVFIFDNNLVHKGTLPVEGYRDVIVIEVYPSMLKMDESSMRKSLVNKFTRDYPVDPYFNDVLNVI